MSSKLKIKISPQALVQIESAAQWWSENRPAAPDAVRLDLAEILDILTTHPGIGQPARYSRIKGLRRIILSRIRYYLYYRASAEALEVLAFWHTSRGSTPQIESKNAM